MKSNLSYKLEKFLAIPSAIATIVVGGCLGLFWFQYVVFPIMELNTASEQPHSSAITLNETL